MGFHCTEAEDHFPCGENETLLSVSSLPPALGAFLYCLFFPHCLKYDGKVHYISYFSQVSAHLEHTFDTDLKHTVYIAMHGF